MSDKGCNNQQLRSPHLSLLVPPPSLQVCCIPTPPSCLPLQSGMARTCRGTGCCSCCCACCCACCCPTSPVCPWPCGCDTCARPPVPGSFVLNLGFRTAPPGWLPPEGSGSVPPAGKAEGCWLWCAWAQRGRHKEEVGPDLLTWAWARQAQGWGWKRLNGFQNLDSLRASPIVPPAALDRHQQKAKAKAKAKAKVI